MKKQTVLEKSCEKLVFISIEMVLMWKCCIAGFASEIVAAPLRSPRFGPARSRCALQRSRCAVQRARSPHFAGVGRCVRQDRSRTEIGHLWASLRVCVDSRVLDLALI